ncbi:MAG: 1,4-alpha-glucan branching enzyme, partial [Chthoniobacterales bacterium]
AENSVVSWLRRSREGEVIVFLVNATPVIRYGYRIPAPGEGFYRELINTDAETYGGGNVGNLGGIKSIAEPGPASGHALYVNLPPLATLAFKKEKIALQE